MHKRADRASLRVGYGLKAARYLGVEVDCHLYIRFKINALIVFIFCYADWLKHAISA
jgi:hypothetical protein